ncbi:membrane or secreted protein [Flavobacteriaceae bacterium]|nr:membrane or secreted protein [Flavobacteriaceae bacterium]MDB9712907.1 membrane or secreted protein [Flavobacteriaceae bacterium]MDC1491797.1 membrane or secreted protein [Flavobacteriaceae bacterium]
MKKLLYLTIYVILINNINSQSFIGAWERNHVSNEGIELKSIVIFSNGYQVVSTYETESGKFVSSNGGTWKLSNKTMTEKVEFDTNDANRVGSIVKFDIEIIDSKMAIVGSNMKFKRIDNGSPGKLEGPWLMSARIRDGKKQLRDTSRPRKTMKILSGTRFQWIAYNTENKKFMGTGGGTYSTINGEYTENIEFFSKDDSKVGLNLKFNFELLNKKWQHKGYSSKGDPIHEIWTKRK